MAIINQKKLLINDGDYIDDDGLYVCGKCNTRKQTIINFGTSEEIVTCLCECESEELKEESIKSHERAVARVKEIRRRFIEEGYRGIYLKDSDTPLPKVENYINNFEEFMNKNIGLMLTGEVGNGKTFIASIIANELIERNYTVVMSHITKTLNLVSQYDNEEMLDRLTKCDLLILDDFGANRDTEYQNEQLNKLIDSRYSVKKPLIITTNLSRKDLAEPKDLSLKRTYDRLIEMTHPMVIEGKGRRLGISKNRFADVEKMLSK